MGRKTYSIEVNKTHVCGEDYCEEGEAGGECEKSGTPVFHCIHIASYNPIIWQDALSDPSEIVIEDDEITIIFDYPLKCEFPLNFRSAGGFSRRSLIEKIVNTYKTIYETEENTTTLPIETQAERAKRLGSGRCHLVNRANTDGTYGIWGHGLSDLFIEEITYIPKDCVVRLGIGS